MIAPRKTKLKPGVASACPPSGAAGLNRPLFRIHPAARANRGPDGAVPVDDADQDRVLAPTGRTKPASYAGAGPPLTVAPAEKSDDRLRNGKSSKPGSPAPARLPERPA
jgi:hypothetical protein